MPTRRIARLAASAGFAAAAAAVGGIAACDQAPIEWHDPVPLSASDTSGRLVVDSAGRARIVPAADATPPVPGNPAGGLCPSSVRTVKGRAHRWAVWWTMRRDSSGVLDLTSIDTGAFPPPRPIAVDTTDIGTSGCVRPPASLAAVGDDVYVAYSLHAPEGRGVFFAHMMGGMIHEPVPVVYGERVVPAAIAVEGDRVVVAYEEPNGSRRRIDVAISETQGHTFDWHVPASRDVDVGRAPEVALAGNVLAVSWIATNPTDSSASRVVRVGRIR